MKKCPFCAEEIQDEAIKCRHCGSMVNSPPTLAEPTAPRDEFEDVRDLARRGEKIAAIKLLRDKTGWDLKKAKDFVERVDDVLVVSRTSEQSTSPDRRSASLAAPVVPVEGKWSDGRVLVFGVGFAAVLLLIFLLNPDSKAPSDGQEQAPITAVPPPEPPAPPPVGAQWNYSQNSDEMTGKVSRSAGVLSSNTVDFEFPYNGAQHGTLTIRRHPRHGNDVIFQLEKGQLLCTTYDGCTVLARFDDAEPLSFSANPAGDNSTETIFISNYERFVSKMRAAKLVRISPKIYQHGGVVFSFDVSGFDMKKFLGQ